MYLFQYIIVSIATHTRMVMVDAPHKQNKKNCEDTFISNFCKESPVPALCHSHEAEI